MSLIFINITFCNGNSGSNGGAIFNSYINTNMTFINCTFINNKAPYGGSIVSYGGINIESCSFNDNSASNGGALFLIGSSNITNSEFTNNIVNATGGAVYIGSSNSSIINCTFKNNIANNGGAIGFSSNTKNNTIDNCIFEHNTANGWGGAIFSNTIGAIIKNSEFNNNSAPNGNGAAILINLGNDSEISNCSFTNNSAQADGAITNYANNVTITNNTIVDNNGQSINNQGNMNGHNNIMDISQNELSFLNVDVSANKLTITVKATGNNGSLIVGRTINFYVNGVLVGSAITNSEGIGELTYTVSNYGQQNIVATLDEFNETFDFEGIADFAIRLYPAATNTTSVNVAEEKVPDNSTPDDDDTPTPKPDIDPRPNPDTIPEPIDNPNDNPVAKAAMKNTGIPIAILLVIALLGVVSYRRKN